MTLLSTLNLIHTATRGKGHIVKLMYGSSQPGFYNRAVTHHTSSGVQLSVRYAAEVAAAASVVFGAVSDGSERVQENLQ